jgi:hypothetical protein
MINTTEICGCGEKKRVNVQWCDGCWDALSESARNKYVMAVDGLTRAQEHCEVELAGYIRKEQPCW